MSATPGPWRYEAATKTIRSKSNYWLATMDSWDGAVDHGANAALIAAAPDLLAALRGLVAWSELMGGWESPAWRAAEAAIARAEGNGAALDSESNGERLDSAPASRRVLVVLDGGLVQYVVTDDPALENLDVDVRDEDIGQPDYPGQRAYVNSPGSVELVSAERYSELNDERSAG